jgi:hypothetical protein
MIMINEIFDEFKQQKTKEAKINLLRKYNSYNFKELLNYAFNPKIQFDISGIPTYKPSVMPAGLNDTYLYLEVNKLYLFIPVHKKYYVKLPPKKEQAILSNVLSKLHPEEAKILIAIMQKKLKIDGLTVKLVKEAFPDIPL